MRKLAVMINAAMAAAVLRLGGASHRARAQDAPTGDAVEGKRIYLAVGCFACHGRSGQGGALNGPAPLLATVGGRGFQLGPKLTQKRSTCVEMR